MPKIKAVLFDLDGVFRDSVGQQWISYKYALKTHDIPEPSDDELRQHAHHIKHVHSHFAGHIPQEDFIGSFYERLEGLRPTVGLYEGTAELVTLLHDAGYKLGLVTSATKAEVFMKSQGLADKFQVIVNGNDTKEIKPHPEPVLHALKALNVDAKEAIMVGDMASDILAAHAAKLQASVGITHGMGTEQTLLAAHADHVVDSLSEIPGLIKEIEHGS